MSLDALARLSYLVGVGGAAKSNNGRTVPGGPSDGTPPSPMVPTRARKHGEYCGGRPWPIICPVCRICGGGPPTHFYNSRGLCNVCHKRERRAGKKSRWPDLPVMLRHGNLAQIAKNPLRWLRNNMTESHARSIPAALAEVECWRIVHVTACRWYGEEVFLDPPTPFDYTGVTYSVSVDAEADMAAPIYDPDAAARDRRKRVAARKRKGKVDPLRHEHIVAIVKPTVMGLAARGLDLSHPRVLIVGDSWTASWVDPNSDTALSMSGTLRSQPSEITITDFVTDEVTEFAYDAEIFAHAWAIFQAVRAANAPAGPIAVV